LWRLVGGRPSQTAREFAAALSAAERRAFDLVEAAHARAPKRPEDALDELSHSKEIAQWVAELRGGDTFVSQALRLAAQAQQLERHVVHRSSYAEGREGQREWRAAVKQWQRQRVMDLLTEAGLPNDLATRVGRLVAKECSADEDPDAQTLQDASCLVFLGNELRQYDNRDTDDGKLADVIQQTWRLMSAPAKAKAAALEYSPRTLGALLEGAAAAEGFEATTSPMVSPRLPRETVLLLRDSWSKVNEANFGDELYDRLFSEDPSLQSVFNYPAARPANLAKVAKMLLELLDAESVPRLERIVHAIAALGAEFGRLKTEHLAPMKRAWVRTATAYAAPREKRRTNQAWEAFYYAICAVAAPHLTLNGRVSELTVATASALPNPDGGTHAGLMAANGVALLEMCLAVSSRSQGGASTPSEVAARLLEAREWLMRAVMDEVNAYCGLISSCLALIQDDPKSSSDKVQGNVVNAEVAERRRWLRRSAEVPLNIAEIAVGSAVACLASRRQVKRSLQPEWIAGAKMLRTATEISLRVVALNLQATGAKGATGCEGLERRFAKLRDTEPPWEDLCDFA